MSDDVREFEFQRQFFKDSESIDRIKQRQWLALFLIYFLYTIIFLVGRQTETFSNGAVLLFYRYLFTAIVSFILLFGLWFLKNTTKFMRNLRLRQSQLLSIFSEDFKELVRPHGFKNNKVQSAFVIFGFSGFITFGWHFSVVLLWNLADLFSLIFLLLLTLSFWLVAFLICLL